MFANWNKSKITVTWLCTLFCFQTCHCEKLILAFIERLDSKEQNILFLNMAAECSKWPLIMVKYQNSHIHSEMFYNGDWKFQPLLWNRSARMLDRGFSIAHIEQSRNEQSSKHCQDNEVCIPIIGRNAHLRKYQLPMIFSIERLDATTSSEIEK